MGNSGHPGDGDDTPKAPDINSVLFIDVLKLVTDGKSNVEQRAMIQRILNAFGFNVYPAFSRDGSAVWSTAVGDIMLAKDGIVCAKVEPHYSVKKAKPEYPQQFEPAFERHIAGVEEARRPAVVRALVAAADAFGVHVPAELRDAVALSGG